MREDLSLKVESRETMACPFGKVTCACVAASSLRSTSALWLCACAISACSEARCAATASLELERAPSSSVD